MIRYIIALKRLEEPRRIHPRVRVLVNGVSQFAYSRGEYTLIPRIIPLAEITSVRSRRPDCPPSLVIIRRLSRGRNRRKTPRDRKDFIRVCDSLRLLPPNDCSTPQSGENYPAGWEMPTDDFTADRALTYG